MRKLLIFVMSLLIGSSTMAQHEDADAVYRKLVKEYTLNPDGSWDFHLEKELEILSYFAFHRLYGESFIVYNPDYQDLNINHAYTIMRDGKRVEAPDNAFNEVLPRGADNAAAYSHLREMVVTHTALEVGAVIHLGYTLHNRADFFPAFMGREQIGENSPIEEMILRVIVPKDTELSHQTYNIRTAPEISTENGKDVYTWKFLSRKANAHEHYQTVTQQPMVVFSSAKDLHRVYDRFVNQDAFRYQAGSQVMEKVKELSAEDDLQSMLNIQKFVQDEIAGFRVSLDEAAYQVRSANQVWQSNGGTALEKAILMTAMLRQANINANVVAIIPDKYYNRELGNLMVIEDFLVQVNPREYGQFYLSSENHPMENLKYTLAGNEILIMDAAIESLRTFSEEPYDNKLHVKYRLKWQEDQKPRGNLTAEFLYHLNPYLKIWDDTAHAKGLFKGISAGEFIQFEVEKSTEKKTQIKAEFEMQKIFKEQSAYFFAPLPEVEDKLPDHFLSALPPERKTPLLLPFPVEISYEYNLNVPDGYEAVVPETVEINNEAGAIKISFKQKGNDIVIERNLDVPQRIIEVNNYGAFRELMINWYDQKHKELVLEKTGV